MGEPTPPQDQVGIEGQSPVLQQAKETSIPELARQLSEQMQTGIDLYRDDMGKSVRPPANEWPPSQGTIDQLTQIDEAFRRLSEDPTLDTAGNLSLTLAKGVIDGAVGRGKVVIAREDADGTPDNELAKLLRDGGKDRPMWPREAQWIIDCLNRGSEPSQQFNSRRNGPYGNTKGGNVALLPNGRILAESTHITGGGGGGRPGFAGSELYVTNQ